MSNQENDVSNEFQISPNKSVLGSISQKWNVIKVIVGLLQQSKHLIRHSFRHKKIYFSIILFLIIMARKKLKTNSNKKEWGFPNIFENQRVQIKDQTNDYINVLEKFQKGIKIPTPTDLFNKFMNKIPTEDKKSVNNESNKEEEPKYKHDLKKVDFKKVDLKKENNHSESTYTLQENERYVLEKQIKVWEEPMNQEKELVFQQYFIYEKNKYYRFEMSCILSDVSNVSIILYKIKGSDFEYCEFEKFSMEGNGIQSNKKDEELYPFKMISDYMYFDDSGKIMIEFVFSLIDKEKTDLGLKNISLKVIEHPVEKVHKTPYYFMTFHNEKKKFAFPVFLKSTNLFLESKLIEEKKVSSNESGIPFSIKDLF